jgi:pyridoxal phosphate enzyme (YggS family)
MYRTRLEETLPAVLERIAEAALRAGRDPSGVQLVAVTKEHPAEAIEALLEAGVRDLAENRIEQIEEWDARFGRDAARWHMIGHLQRRKAPEACAMVHLLHSVDSVRLAGRLNEVVPPGGEPLPILVQVNTSGEETKGGFGPPEALDGIGRILEMRSLRVRGLMTMAPYYADERLLRQTFGTLRGLHEEAREQFDGYEGEVLSMGMSNDFEVAIEEGSTMVRLGTVLLGGYR